MQVYWILPNREQADEILVSDGKHTMPLRQILDPKSRPPGFSHGVPTELLEKCGPKGFAEVLFAQRFFNWDGNKQIFSILSTAGVDSSERVVHIGLLFILEPQETPKFEISYAGLSEKDKTYAKALVHRLMSPGRSDFWVQSVRELMDLSSGAGPATNVALDRSTVKFHSLYVFGPAGLTKQTAYRMKLRMAALILLIVFMVVGVWIFVHGKYCSRHSELILRQTSQQNGVALWRFK